ncbi:TMV resistance protein N-like [Senna tora]|uniref:TMV resistance protein N-like n=1 Tax=Senna tora TaxID=362788 RepID=A0A834X0J8_9FABA|nr:TMV resistance protein N-like [Senna tora]
MAASSSAASTTSSAGSASSGSLSSTAQSKTFTLFSSSSQTTSVKLDRSNYLLWESVVLSLIEGNQLESHIDGSFDKSFQPPKWQNSGSSSGGSSSQAQAYFATPQVVDDPSWYVDSGATHHVTPNTEQLDYYTPVGFLNRRVDSSQDGGSFPLLVTSQVDVGCEVETELSRGRNDEHDAAFNGSPTANSPSHEISLTNLFPMAHNVPRGSSNLNSSGSSPFVSRDRAEGTNSSQRESEPCHSSVGPAVSNTLDQAQNTQNEASSINLQAQQRHPMVTRARDSTLKPRHPYIGLLHSEVSASASLAAEPLTGNDSRYLQAFVQKLNKLFSLKDLGPLFYFLGIEIYRDSSGLYLNQSKYVQDLLCKFKMSDCASVSTPMVTGKQYSKTEGELLTDVTLYRQAIRNQKLVVCCIVLLILV